jgi:hypothetical protein
VDAVAPSSLKLSPATLDFFLEGPPGAKAKATVYYQVSAPEGSPPAPGLPAVTENLEGVSQQTWSLQTNQAHVLLWRFELAEGIDSGSPQLVRVWVQIGKKSLTEEAIAAIDPWEVGNAPPAIEVGIEVPAEETGGFVSLPLLLSDSSSDEAFVIAEFRRDQDPWQLARPAGAVVTPAYGLSNIPTVPAPTEQVFVWDSSHDLAGDEASVSLRFTPIDIHEGQATAGTSRETTSFQVDNNAPPAVQLLADAFFIDADVRHGVRVPYRVTDAEGDPVRVLLQWRRPGSEDTYAELDLDAEELAAVLDDPTARRALRIGTELPQIAEGRVAPSSAVLDPLTELALPELPVSGQVVLGTGLGGRELEILRPWTAPRSASGSWPAAPTFDAPVGAVISDDGATALVLEGPGATWTLRRLDLVTGAPLGAVIASGEGHPDALSQQPDGAAVILATSDAVSWSLHRVELSTGAVTIVGSSADGAVPQTPVKGLLALGSAATLLSSDDALVRVDHAIDALGLPARAVALRSGLHGLHGLALDPLTTDRLILAQTHDSVAELGFGGLSALDLSTGALSPIVVASTGGVPGLPRPTSIAFERPGRLLAVVDESPFDGVRALRGIDLGATLEGQVFELADNLPDETSSVDTGPDALRLLAVPGPGAGDLLLGGGLLCRRSFVPEPADAGGPLPFDPATLVGTVSEPFPVEPPAGAPWRITRTAMEPRIEAFGSEGTLIWDVHDVPGGGDVVLRLIPFDTDLGAPSDLLLSKSVAGDVYSEHSPVEFGPAMQILDVEVADLDGDGLLDLAFAGSAPSRSMGVLFQETPGAFLLDAASPVRGPDAAFLAVADVDGDGLVDLAGVVDTPALVVHRQALPRTFEFSPWVTLDDPEHVSVPVGLCAADMDGDGRPDLVTADFLKNRATVYQQDPGVGGFPPTPTFVLGDDVDTSRPTAVCTADVDADGQLDVLVSATNSNAVALFRQLPGGGFAATPDELLSGPVAPAELMAADVDRDGLTDVVAAVDSFDSLGVWFQRPGEGFADLGPDLVLPGEVFHDGLTSLEIVDVDGDGLLDLLTSKGSSGAFGVEPERVQVRHQASGGGFPDAPGLALTPAGIHPSPSAVRAADLDGDGRQDLVWAGTLGADDDVGIAFADALFTPGVQAHVALGVASPVRDLKAADIDADGLLDLVVVMRDADLVGVWLQSFLSSYATTPSLVLGGNQAIAGPTAVAPADLDGDGRCDLAVANLGDQDLAVFLQTPSGGYLPEPGQRLGGPGETTLPQDLVAADVDHDGDLDLVSANAGAAQGLTIFRQLAPGIFETSASTTLSDPSLATPQRLAAADVDRDGRLDLLCTNLAGCVTSVFLQDGGDFGDGSADLLLGGEGVTDRPFGLAVADVDGDRLLDVLVTSLDRDDVSIFLGRAEGALFGADPVTPDLRVGDATTTNAARDVVVVDVDHDGQRDLVTTFFKDGFEGAPTISIFRQISPRLFASSPVLQVGTPNFPVRILATDLDGDGDVDLVAGDVTSALTVVHFGGR